MRIYIGKYLSNFFKRDQAITLYRIYPKKFIIDVGKNLAIRLFLRALFRIMKNWKQPKCPTELARQIMVNTNNGKVLSH